MTGCHFCEELIFAKSPSSDSYLLFIFFFSSFFLSFLLELAESLWWRNNGEGYHDEGFVPEDEWGEDFYGQYCSPFLVQFPRNSPLTFFFLFPFPFLHCCCCCSNYYYYYYYCYYYNY